MRTVLKQIDDSFVSDVEFMVSDLVEEPACEMKSTIKIDKPIESFRIVDREAERKSSDEVAKANLEVMGRHLKPKTLNATRYEIRSPKLDESFYVIISDIILNKDTQYEVVKPYEVFISSLNSEHYQYITGLAVLISGIFQSGMDSSFVIASLQKIVDPAGGYYRPPEEGETKGKFISSVVASIGDILERHFYKIGLINDSCVESSEINEFYSEYKSVAKNQNSSEIKTDGNSTLAVCNKCGVQAVKFDGGCSECQHCGESRCQ